MKRLYDSECVKCNHILEQFAENEDSFILCPLCGHKMKRLFSKMSFKLIYDNKKDMCAWGDNNYETSQYWSKVKEARERGEDVKAVNE